MSYVADYREIAVYTQENEIKNSPLIRGAVKKNILSSFS